MKTQYQILILVYFITLLFIFTLYFMLYFILAVVFSACEVLPSTAVGGAIQIHVVIVTVIVIAVLMSMLFRVH